MSRWNAKHELGLDDPWQSDGDRFFNAWNSKLHRAILPEGTVCKSINKRFTDGRASPRKGTIMPNGNRYWYVSDNTQRFVGSGVYNNNNGEERLILVPMGPFGTQGINSYDVDNDVYRTIDLPPGVSIPTSATCWFASCFGQLVMLISNVWNNVPGHQTNGLVWDGNEVTRVFQWFQWNGISDTQVIPPSFYAQSVSNRIAYWWNFLDANNDGSPPWAVKGAVFDHLLLSDVYGDETGAFQNLDPTLQDFRINAGTSDRIIGIVPYAFDTIIIFMKRSIMSLSNFSLDPTQAGLEVLTQYFGCAGPRAFCQIGTEVYFMSERKGVFKLSEILNARIVAEPLPISDDIQPDIDRINWKYQDQIVFAPADNYLFIAAPIDGSTFCNAVFVFNMTTSKWETIDQYNIPMFRIDNLLSIHISGVRRLLAIQNGPPALVYLLYEGTQDQTVFDVINPRFADIPDYIETRGYGLTGSDDPTAWRTYHRGSIVIDTLRPNVKVTAITEGVNEVKTLRPSITKDPHKYYIFGKPDFKAGTDPNQPKRQDYSIGQPGQSFEGQDFEQMPEGDISLQGGVIPPVIPVPGQQPFTPTSQNSRERFPIKMTDRWVSLGIANIQGTCTVVSASVESTEARRNARVAA